MSLRDYWLVLRKHWLLMVAMLLLSLGAGGLATELITPMYAATTQDFVSTQGSLVASDLLTGSNFTQQRVKSYADLVTSSAVLNPVIQKLKLGEKGKLLKDRITADVPLNTVLINITVQDESPRLAAKISNEVSDSLSRVVNALEKPENSKDSPVRLSQTIPGTVDLEPVSPKPWLNLGLSALIGLLVGFGLGMLRDLSDVTLRRVDEALEITGSTVLGALSFNPDVPEHPLTVHTSPKSHQAEAFRHLRTGVKFVEIATGVNTIVVSSSIPNEGKTVTASNLAIAMADSGSKVLLIDGDLRKPNIAKIMDIDGNEGLCDLLIGQRTAAKVVQRWGSNGLFVLPAGKVPPNPSELLGSRAMEVFLEKARATYDMVIIDAPPLLPVTDGIILSKLGGSLLMVVAVGKVKRPQLRNSIELMQNAGSVLLGLVLNKIPIKGVGSEVYRSGYGYGRGYGYGYGRGYGVYGAASTPYGQAYPANELGTTGDSASGPGRRS